MSSSSSYAKIFVMSFESNQNKSEKECEVKKLMNPDNRLYAICLIM